MQQAASIAEARAFQASQQERLLAQEAIAVANRTLALKNAEITSEADAANARAEAAGPLAATARDQEILIEQEKVAQKQAALKESQLDTEIRKPADAQRYRVEQEAQGAKSAAILEADADRQATIAGAQAAAEQQKLSGEGERSRRAALAEAEAEAIEGARTGDAERSRRSAIAEAVRLEGDAEASAILARGKAEAESLDAKARAFADFGEAAVLDLLVRVLPDVVREDSAPLAAVEKMTVISSDGAGALSKSVASNIEQGLQISSDLTGTDLRALLARLGEKVGAEPGRVNGAPQAAGGSTRLAGPAPKAGA